MIEGGEIGDFRYKGYDYKKIARCPGDGKGL